MTRPIACPGERPFIATCDGTMEPVGNTFASGYGLAVQYQCGTCGYRMNIALWTLDHPVIGEPPSGEDSK